MLPSLQTRRLQIAISLVMEKLQRAVGEYATKFQIASNTVEASQEKNSLSPCFAPENLRKSTRKIAFVSDCPGFKEMITHLAPNAEDFSVSFLHDEPDIPSLDHFEKLIVVTTNEEQSQNFQDSLSTVIDEGIAVSAYCFDSAQNEFVSMTYPCSVPRIPAGIFPHLHNPLGNTEKPAGTAVFNYTVRPLQSFSRFLHGLRPPFFISPSLSPRDARNTEVQAIILSELEDREVSDSLLRHHIAVGIPLKTPYSTHILNEFPAIDLQIDGSSTRRSTYYSAEFRKYLTLRQVTKIFEGPSIYRALHTMIESGVTAQAKAVPWKDRILVVCDDESDSFADLINSQTGVRVTLVNSTQAKEIDERVLVKEFDYIARMSTDYVYPSDYLSTKICGFKYTQAEFVTESTIPSQRANSFTHLTDYPSLSVSSTHTSNCLQFFTLQTTNLQGNGYCTPDGGASQLTSLHHKALELTNDEYVLSIIVPVFNNGEYLLAKALPSLLRNRSWFSMEIILVDDGSTDAETTAICRFLNSLFPNVILFEFPPGGSGSASRARNKGIQLASSSVVSFLDPDNQISDFGYDRLLARYSRANSGSRECDIVSGFQMKVGETVSYNARHSYSPWPTTIQNPRAEFFDSGLFPTISTQASVIKKQLLMEHQIEFTHGAVGQDTLFGWEVLYAAKNPTFTREAHLLYFSERSNSVTNSLNADFFRKSLVREKAQVKWLFKNGLLDTYLRYKYDYFFNNWYLEKFKLLEHGEKYDALGYLDQIAKLYGKSPT